MSEILLWLLLVAAIAAVWIEWVPGRQGVFAYLSWILLVVPAGLWWTATWYGWVALLCGVAILALIYFSPRRRKEWPNLFSAPAGVLRECLTAVKSAAHSVAGRIRNRKRAENIAPPGKKTNFLTIARLLNAVAAVPVVILSPLAALPSAIVVSALLVAWEAFFGNTPQHASDLQEAAKQVLEVSVYAIFAAYVLVARHFWIAGPLLFAGGYAIAARAIGSGAFWRRYMGGLLLIGAIYPALYVAGDVFHWIDMPYID